MFLAESRQGEIIVLRDANNDGVAEFRETFATEMDRPFGLAFREGHLYIGANSAVVRFLYRDGQTKATGEPETIVELPPSNQAVDRDTAARLGIELRQTRGYNHWTRNLIFSRDGTKLYVTIGSATNSTPGGDERRAAVNEYAPDGGSHRIFASGLRNPVGLAFYPGTDVLWTSVNERDQLGDDVPPDYITSVQDGGFYGWPYSYIGRHVDPTVTPHNVPTWLPKQSRPKFCCRPIRHRWASSSIRERSFPRSTATARSSRCTARSTGRGLRATR